SQIDAAAGSITLNAGQNFALGDAASAGTSSITGGGDLAISAGGTIDLSGGTAGAQAGSAIIEITGDASLMATGDISLLAGSVADADVGVAAENISLDSGADILLQGGTATGADVLVDANGTADLNATGDLTVQGGSAVGANAIVLSNSLTTINIGAASVSLLTDTGQALLNVLDGAAGSTVNITTPGACVNCVQVALADPEGIVADVINIYGQPEEPVPPTVEPPEVVVESPDPVVEDPVVIAPPQPTPEPEDEVIPEPEEMTPPDDIINEVLVLNSNDDETDLGQQSAATESTGEDDEGEAEEEPTQCRA
ncbi:MAG: hypothetical protein KJP04_09760, partial [Arenicella sp.]|nr:hypothetical protein [Arenicella sp.]